MATEQEQSPTYSPESIKHVDALPAEQPDELQLKVECESKEKRAKYDMLGFMWGLLGSLGNILSAGCLQGLQGQIPYLQLLFFRFFTHFVIIAGIFVWKRQLPRIARKDILFVLLWVLGRVSFNFCLFGSYSFLPLGVVTSSCRISAMIITVPVAHLLLKEKVTALKLAGVLIGSVGLLLVCKPDLFLGSTSEQFETISNISDNGTIDQIGNVTTPMTLVTLDQESSSVITNQNQAAVGYTLSAGAAISSVIQVVILRKRLLHLSTLVLLFWMVTIGTCLCLILLPIFGTFTWPSDWVSWLLLMGNTGGLIFYSFIGLIGQYYASAVVIQLAYSSQVFVSFLGQYFILQHIFPSDKSWISILGAALSTIAVTLVPGVQIIKVKMKNRAVP